VRWFLQYTLSLCVCPKTNLLEEEGTRRHDTAVMMVPEFRPVSVLTLFLWMGISGKCILLSTFCIVQRTVEGGIRITFSLTKFLTF
jgi:hypothetical protein